MKGIKISIGFFFLDDKSLRLQVLGFGVCVSYVVIVHKIMM